VASALYMLFFYNSVLGMPARLVGLAAGVSLIWDAVIDPVIGRLSDGTSGRFGRRHGWMLAGAVGTAVGFVALFSPPSGLPVPALFAWLILAWLLLRTCHSMFTVPYTALGAELCPEYDARTEIAGYRALAAQAGAMAASALTLLVFFPSGGAGGDARQSPDSYAAMAIGLGTLMTLAGCGATLGTWGVRHRLAAGLAVGTPEAARPDWRRIVRTRPFALLTASASLHFLAGVVGSVLSVYFMTYYARIGSNAMAACQFALYVGGLTGIPLWMALARRHEKHHLQVAASVGGGLLAAAGFWLGQPGGPLGAQLVPGLVAAYACLGLVSSGVAVLPGSMIADAAAAHELATGERREGAFFGVFSACLQVAAGLGTVVAGVLVDAFARVVPGAAPQDPGTVIRIGLLACVLPGALMLAAGLVALPYGLDRRRVRAIQEALDARRAAAGLTAAR
jgi:GPH family glycoside/pentoside/hexuronide:cation symporter